MVKEKVSWKKLKGESQKAYDRFYEFLKLSPQERSLEQVHQILNSQKKSGKNKKTKLVSKSSIEQMSSKWCWFERAALYDQNKILEEIEENTEDFKKTNEKFKKTFKDSLNFADKLLQELIQNENDNALSTRINMFNTLMNVLDSLYKNYRLTCGRSTHISESSNDHHVESNVTTQIIGEENIYEHTDEELEKILTINDDFDDFTDEL